MKLLLYCTKAKPILSKVEFFYGDEDRTGYECIPNTKKGKKYLEQMGIGEVLNGKIVAECDFEVEKIELLGDEINLYYGIENKSCLTTEQIENYLGYDNDYKGYAIHIKNLQIFDKPRDIRNYYNIAVRTMADCMNQRNLRKPPQNMCNAYNVYKNHYILISIKPEWLCKILNGEKTIEVRKKVLKGLE